MKPIYTSKFIDLTLGETAVELTIQNPVFYQVRGGEGCMSSVRLELDVESHLKPLIEALVHVKEMDLTKKFMRKIEELEKTKTRRKL